MSVRQWSSETVIADHRDLQCSCLGVSRDGGVAVLAGRRSLALINLAEPSQVAKKVGLANRWEVTGLVWNPTAQLSSFIALASGDKIDIYNSNQGDVTQADSLRGHNRPVCDICWNVQEPVLLASTSLDGNIHIWDVREHRRPSKTLHTMAGANLVRWSRTRGHLLAAAHEGDIKLWDLRQPTHPATSLSPHISRIHSLDWSYRRNHLVSSSADCTVKFQLLIGDNSLEPGGGGVLSTAVPIWRALYTPFGEGMVTVLMPRAGRQGPSPSIYLWNVGNLSAPVHSLVGHRDIILDFGWRRVGDEEHQLVTWSRDQTLRIWSISQEMQYRCSLGLELTRGTTSFMTLSSSEPTSPDTATEALEDGFLGGVQGVDQPLPTASRHTLPSRGQFYSGMNLPEVAGTELHETNQIPATDGAKDHTKLLNNLQLHDAKEAVPTAHCLQEPQPGSVGNILQKEFALLDTNFSFLRVLEKDLERRVCTILAVSSSFRLLLLVTFPPSYPLNTAPAFTWLKGSSMNEEVKARLLLLMQETALNQVKRNRPCLERCLRQLEYQLVQVQQEERAELRKQKASFPFAENSQYSVFQDSSVPYPRTSGARFCGNSLLVCFGRPAYRMQVKNDALSGPTPRAYSAFLSSMTNRSDQHSLFPGMALVPPLPGDQLNIVKRGRFKVRRVGSSSQDEKLLRTRKLIIVRSSSSSNNNTINISRLASVALNVTIYNVSRVLPVSALVAQRCVLLSTMAETCRANERITEELERPDLANTWRLAGEIGKAAEEMKGECDSWSDSPLGSKLLQSLLYHHARSGDFQTVALLVCTFSHQTLLKKAVTVESPREQLALKDRLWFLRQTALQAVQAAQGLLTTPAVSPYHTVHADSCDSPERSNRKNRNTCSHPSLERVFSKSLRSNSWSDAHMEILTPSAESSPTKRKGMQASVVREGRLGLLLQADTTLHSQAIQAYSDLLYNWKLLKQRTQIQKHSTVNTLPDYQAAKVSNSGRSCCHHAAEPGSCCATCSRLRCAICRTPVRGLSSLCPACGHGGHLAHWLAWFGGQAACPTGCGCLCGDLITT